MKPLSAIKDMIGSQATKGMHVLAKFAPKIERCGVWTDAAGFTVIEAYPSGCKGSATVTVSQIEKKTQSCVVALLQDRLGVDRDKTRALKQGLMQELLTRRT